jgi:hypothetical protein
MSESTTSNTATPVMPDFSHSFHGFHHTIDSALETLSSHGISASRITVRMAGLGWPDHWVIEQDPAPGAELTPDVRLTLDVAGLGFFQALPVGMWDKGGEAEPGTFEIVQVFDDPLQKAAHWVRQGARLFDIRPDNHRACRRWIELFGLDPESWPRENWYHLALLLPNLHRLAGRKEGMELAFRLLLGLPIFEIRRRAGWRYLADPDLSVLGEQYSRLGVDTVIGDRMESLGRQTIKLGPVSLKTYYSYQQEDKARLIDAVLNLSSACHQQYRISWLVLNPARPPRLGFEEQNARLGVNSHLGQPEPAPATA